MATRHFPPSPPILSHLGPHSRQPPPHPQVPSQPSLTSPFLAATSAIPAMQYPGVLPAALPTEASSGSTNPPFPWSPSSQSAQPIYSQGSASFGGRGTAVSPLDLGGARAADGTGEVEKGGFHTIALSPVPVPIPGSIPNTARPLPAVPSPHALAPDTTAGAVVGQAAGIPTFPVTQMNTQGQAQAQGILSPPSSDISGVIEAMQRLNVQSLGPSPIPGVVGLRQKQPEVPENVTSYLLSPATAGVVKPPGQVAQVAPTIGDVKHGYDQAIRVGSIQDMRGRDLKERRTEVKVAEKVLGIHKAYQELVDRLHEDFVKERRIWAEERKLYEFRIREFESCIKTLEFTKLAPDRENPERTVAGSEGLEQEKDKYKGWDEGNAKWEPPPLISHSSGAEYGLESSRWAPEAHQNQKPHLQLHPSRQQAPPHSHQSLYISSLPPHSGHPGTPPRLPNATQFGYSYSHPQAGDFAADYSYPRPPTRDDISRPDKKKGEKRPSSRVSFTSPTTARSYAYHLSSECKGPSSLSPEPERQAQTARERRHTFPIPPPLPPGSVERQPEGAMIGPYNAEASKGSLETFPAQSDCDPEPILKSPASKAVDIISPIPIHKIDPLHISPSPTRDVHSASSGTGADHGGKLPPQKEKEDTAPVWHARSKSSGGMSEGGRSEAAESDVKLVLKKNNNFGAGLNGWSFKMPKMNFDGAGGGESEGEFGYGGEKGGGWTTPKGGFLDV